MLQSAIETADASGFCLNIRFLQDYLFGWVAGSTCSLASIDDG
jgi:hypothetical protein